MRSINIFGLTLVLTLLVKSTYSATSSANSVITVVINPATSINLTTSSLQMTALAAGGVQGSEVSSSFETFATFGSSIIISAVANNLAGSDGTNWETGDMLMIEALGFSEQTLIRNGESTSLVPIAHIKTISNITTPYTLKYFNNNSSRSTGNLSCVITLTASSP